MAKIWAQHVQSEFKLKEFFAPIFGPLTDWRFVRAKLVIDIQTNLAGTRIGLLWLVLDPIILAAVYYFVVVIVFERGGPNFHLVILSGLFPWLWFARGLSQGAVALTSNRGSILSLNTPWYRYLIAPVLLNGCFFLLGLLVLFLVIPEPAKVPAAFLALNLAVLFSLIYALGYVLSLLNVFARDTTRVLEYVVRLGFFMTPVIYEAERVTESLAIPQLFKQLYVLNPMYIIVHDFRELMLHARLPDLIPSLTLWLIAVMLLLVANSAALRLRNKVIERL